MIAKLHRVAGRAAGLALLALLAAPRAAVTNERAVLSAADFEPAVRTAETMPRMHSLLVGHKGELLVERYFHGRDAADLDNIKSASKSIISALVGIAIERGHLTGVDQPIADFFEPRLARDADPRKRRITIEDLLIMQAGLETTSNRNYGAWVASSDWIGFALRQPYREPHGTRMEYSTGNTHLLSAILTKATGQDTLGFARDALAEPLGFRLAPWPQDPQGIYFGGNDMTLTPRQMMAFGELYLNGGQAEDRPIVPAGWVESSLRPRTHSAREAGRYYGYGWWIREMAGLRTPYAWGYGGQYIVLVPALDMVVVTTSSSHPGPGRRAHRRRLLDLIERSIVGRAARAL